tara:strand:- start:10092 stop:11423 length:1332 start_codon:yes stop_codon:yes gene_type:complete
MPPRNRNVAFQQFINQTPVDSTGSFRQVQRDELFPGAISRDFATSRAVDPTISKYDVAYGGNPVMDLVQNMYQGGVGDTRGTGGMPGSGSDPMNYAQPAEMITGSFQNTTPRAELYDLEMNEGLGMPGSGSYGSFTPDRSAANIVEQSNPLMQIKRTDPQVNLPSLAGYDYPEDPEGTSLEPPVQTSGSFRSVPNPTEQAYQASLPGINRIQANAQTQMAMNEGRLDPSPRYARTANLKRGVQIGAPYQGTPDSLKEVTIPEEMQPGMLYNAREAAPGVADKVAKGAGGLARGIAGFGGNMINAFLYGAGSKKGLRENLNQTFYGGKGTLGQNVLGLPAPQDKTAQTAPVNSEANQAIGPTKSGKPMGGFKSAFAAARKAGKKTFKWKNPRTGKTITYTTALASDKKKSSDKKKGNDPSALQGSFRPVKPKITSPLLTGKGYR